MISKLDELLNEIEGAIEEERFEHPRVLSKI